MKFIKTFYFSSIFLITIIILFNYFIDNSRRYFHEKRAIKNILNNLELTQKVKLESNLNERIYKKEKLFFNTNRINDIDIAVCGTSRGALIGNSLSNKKILNLSYSGSTILDSLIMCNYANDHKIASGKIILSFEPNVFLNNYESNSWSELFYDNKLIKYYTIYKYNTQNLNLVILKNKYDNFKKLLSFQLLSDNIKSILHKKNSENIWLFYDGSYLADESKSLSTNDIETLALKDLLVKTTINNKNYDLIEKFINNSKNNEIIFLLLPFHERYYEIVNNHFFYKDVEKELLQLSKKFNIKLIGSFNIKLTECKSDEFTDNLHPKQICIKKILKEIL
jgi:hypothetical protein